MLWRKSYYGMVLMVPLASALVILLLTGACSPTIVTDAGIEERQPIPAARPVTLQRLYQGGGTCQVFYFYDEARDMNCWWVKCGGTAIDCEPAGGGRR